MSSLYKLDAPVEFKLACSSRFRSKKDVFFLPVITDGTELTIAGRAIPEFHLLPTELQESFLEVFVFARKQYRSNFQLPLSLTEFQDIAQRLRHALTLPDAFRVSCGVRIGMNRFLTIDDSTFRSGCIVRFGEDDSILIRDSVDEALIGLGLRYTTIPVEIGGERSGWKEIVPEFYNAKTSVLETSASSFLKDEVSQQVFLRLPDERVKVEVEVLLSPLLINS